jgi:peptide chain release factor 2
LVQYGHMTTLELQQRLTAISPALGITDKRALFEELKKKSEDPNLWEDRERAVATLAELREIETLLATWDELQEFLSMGDELSQNELISLERQVRTLERVALLSDEHDRQDAIVTIHAGTGGIDAQDWAEILERMILRYVEQGKTEDVARRTLSIDRASWKATIIEETKGEEAGIKKVVLEVSGAYAYGLLKAEAGVHRLVRLSPFNAKNLRQTSFALIEIIPEVEQNSKVAIDEKELRIDVFRSGGNGGQGVNTTDSAVRITHLPSGIVVAVQNERSQHQNKATAMKILQSKLVRLLELKNAEETAILKGEFKEGSWGNQIRSYVMQPYQLVKDHRTDHETANIQAVLDGDLGPFIETYLIHSV